MSDRICFRDACRNDSADIAGYLLSAWPVEVFLGMDESLTVETLKEIVRGYVESEDTIYSYRNTIVAVCDGKVVGAINGYDGNDFKELKRPVAEDLRRRFGDVPYASVEETGPGEFYLDSIGVSEEMRSRGVGSGLFRAMIRRARLLGHKVAGLLVDYDNPRAEALYRRLGFGYVGDTDFMGHRMKHLQVDTESFDI